MVPVRRIWLLLAGAAGVTAMEAPAEQAGDGCPVHKEVLGAVIKDETALVALSTGFSSPEYPGVWVAPVGNNSCTKTFDQAVRVGRKYPKMSEMLMETGMIKFLGSGHYPRLLPAVPEPAGSTTSGLVFLPFCFYTEGVKAKNNGTIVTGPDGRRRKINGTLQWVDGFYKARWRFQATDVSRTVEQLLAQVQGRQVLFVKVHPQAGPKWSDQLRRTRSVQIDKTMDGLTRDIVAPPSIETGSCPCNPNTRRSMLLFFAGHINTGRPIPLYDFVRPTLASLLQQLRDPTVDASTNRPYDEYKLGFFNAKFCTVTPGHTLATAQATRAICAGCVPVFVTDEPRDLPFAKVLNYTAFSLVKSIHEATQPGAATRLVQELTTLVETGGYTRLAQNLALVRSFFDFQNFGAHGPYAATLLAVAADLRA